MSSSKGKHSAKWIVYWKNNKAVKYKFLNRFYRTLGPFSDIGRQIKKIYLFICSIINNINTHENNSCLW